MKRLLILFANGFPYNNSEPFLENESPLYGEYFDHVLISTACKRGEIPTRDVQHEIIEVLNDYTLSKDIRSIFEAIPWVLRDKMFYRELKQLWSTGFSMGKCYRILVFALCGNHRAKQVERWLKKNPEYEDVVLYSYWLHIPAYGAVRVKQQIKRGKTISRAHGFDLYAERYPDGYLPFQQQMVEQLEEILPISQQGTDYLQDKYGHEDKISACYLGAKYNGKHNPICDRKPFRIVTCSRTIPLKRLDRVVDALCMIQDIPVQWTHIGSGESQKALEQYAQEKLPPNITSVFTGNVPNQEIYEIYEKRPFHLFINVSETEGIPVAIMEAMSFGIPVIATNVGGTSELVADGVCGYLLERDFENEKLVEMIYVFAHMREEEYRRFRLSAEKVVRDKFNIEANCRLFIEEHLLK